MPDEINPYYAGEKMPAIAETTGGPPPTTADFLLEADDVAAFLFQAPETRKQVRTLRMGLGFGFVFTLVLGWIKGIGFLPLIPASVLILGMLVWHSPPLWRRRIRKSCAKTNAGVLPQPQTVALASEGIHVTTPQTRILNQWQGVERIEASPTHAVFCGQSLPAVIVPARAFRSEALFHAFVNLARELAKHARQESNL